MTILSILAAPSADFSARLFESFNSSVSLGHILHKIDLYLEEFDPVLRPEKAVSSQVENYQKLLQAADLVVFFYPVHWMHLPAILKGFIDQVFVKDIAFKEVKKYRKGLLKNKSALVISTSYEPNWQINFLYGNPLKIFWTRSVFGLCKFKKTSFYNYAQIQSQTKDVQDHILSEVKLLGTRI
jgi:NAD(P)H dehydrogenase (quinone)